MIISKLFKSSADNLLVVINDILDLSKLQAGKMEFERIPFRLRDVTGHALDIMRLKAEGKGLVLAEDINGVHAACGYWRSGAAFASSDEPA